MKVNLILQGRREVKNKAAHWNLCEFLVRVA